MKRKLLLMVLAMLVGVFAMAQEKMTPQQEKEMAIQKIHGPTVEVPKAEAGSRAIGDDCSNPISVTLPAALPYSDLGQTNCGRGNTYSSTCLGYYDGGEDIIYEFVVTSDVTIDISMATTTTYTGMAVLDGCPDVGTCLYDITGSGSSKSLTGVVLTAAGSPYYLIIDTWPAPNCIPTFDLTITEVMPCLALPIPWTEGFEGMSTVGSGIVPVCMVEDGDFASADAPTSYNRSARTGTNYMYTNWSANDWLYSPPLDLVGGTTYDFSFWYKNYGSSGWTTLEAFYGTGQTSGDMTTAVGTPVSGATNTSYEEYRGSFTPASSGTYYVGIHVVANYSPWYMCFDDLSVDLPLSCPAPSDQTVSNITTTSADLNWVDNAGDLNWEITIGPTGMPPPATPTPVNNAATGAAKTFHATGLTHSTAYDWYVRAICGPGDESTWTGPHTFTTTCEALTTFPWVEDFEGNFLPVCWSKIVQAGNDISQNDDQNHTMGGMYSARFSSFSTSADYNQYLFSPAMTLEEAHRILSFWYKKYRDQDDELLEWGVATTTDPNDFVWTPVDLTTDWKKINIDLQPYVGQTVYIGFHYYGDYLYYVYLDDVMISATPPVPVSNWAIVLGVLLIGIFTFVIYRKRKLA